MRTSSFGSSPRALLALVVAAITVGCAKEAEIEDLPNLSSLALVYDHPDGVVAPATVASSIAGAVQIAAIAVDSGFGAFFRESYGRAKDKAAELLARARDDDRLDAEHVDIEMNIEVRRVCNGWLEPSAPPNPEQNGAFKLRAVVRDDGTLPTALGTTVGPCRQTVSIDGTPRRLVIDGEVATYGFLVENPLLVRISGAFGSATGSVSGSIDFRLMPNGQVEVRMPARDGGSVIFFIGAGEIGVRGANGRFVCSEAAHTCSGPGGDAFQW